MNISIKSFLVCELLDDRRQASQVKTGVAVLLSIWTGTSCYLRAREQQLSNFEKTCCTPNFTPLKSLTARLYDFSWQRDSSFLFFVLAPRSKLLPGFSYSSYNKGRSGRCKSKVFQYQNLTWISVFHLRTDFFFFFLKNTIVQLCLKRKGNKITQTYF